jgi:hypothetical protein
MISTACVAPVAQVDSCHGAEVCRWLRLARAAGAGSARAEVGKCAFGSPAKTADDGELRRRGAASTREGQRRS